MGLQIDSDEIKQAENAGFGNTHRLADDRIGFFNGDTVFKREPHRYSHPKNADPVGNKAGSVLAVDNRFAEQPVTKVTQRCNDPGPGIRTRHELQ